MDLIRLSILRPVAVIAAVISVLAVRIDMHGETGDGEAGDDAKGGEDLGAFLHVIEPLFQNWEYPEPSPCLSRNYAVRPPKLSQPVAKTRAATIGYKIPVKTRRAAPI